MGVRWSRESGKEGERANGKKTPTYNVNMAW